jgi:hypothetical protein
MAHFAEVDENNIVLRVLVTNNDDENGDEGYKWLVDNLGGRWIKTSYNTYFNNHMMGGVPLRGNYASEGYSYDETLDIFLPPKPYASWIVNAEKASWKAPVPKPEGADETHDFLWNEETLTWVEVTLEA